MTGAVFFVVPGRIQPWQRAGIGNGRVVFTKPATRAFKGLVSTLARVAMAGRPPMDGALSLEIAVTVGVPKSWTAQRRKAALDGQVMPTGRPDFDNLAKGIADAMNEIVYRDDAQICRATIRKSYGAAPQAAVTITEI